MTVVFYFPCGIYVVLVVSIPSSCRMGLWEDVSDDNYLSIAYLIILSIVPRISLCACQPGQEAVASTFRAGIGSYTYVYM